jgi:hypothetical protein
MPGVSRHRLRQGERETTRASPRFSRLDLLHRRARGGAQRSYACGCRSPPPACARATPCRCASAITAPLPRAAVASGALSAQFGLRIPLPPCGGSGRGADQSEWGVNPLFRRWDASASPATAASSATSRPARKAMTIASSSSRKRRIAACSFPASPSRAPSAATDARNSSNSGQVTSPVVRFPRLNHRSLH